MGMRGGPGSILLDHSYADTGDSCVHSQPRGAQVSDQEQQMPSSHWTLGLELQGAQTPQAMASSQLLPHPNSTPPTLPKSERRQNRRQQKVQGGDTGVVWLGFLISAEALLDLKSGLST